MQNKAENDRALALRVPGRPGLSDAKKLVFAALGGRNWGVLEIEIIAGRDQSLLSRAPGERRLPVARGTLPARCARALKFSLFRS